MAQQQNTRNTPSELCHDILSLTNRVERLEDALPRNDLGKPDFDWLRIYSGEKKESARAMREYQQTATKNVIKLFITGLISAVGLGLNWDTVLQAARDALMGGLLP